MGIKDLNTFLKDKCPEVFEEVSIKNFNGKSVAIDAMSIFFSIYVVAYRSIVYKTNVLCEEPNIIFIRNLFISMVMNNIIIKFLKNNITPIIVFDGKAPEEKFSTQEKRSSKKKEKKVEIKDYKEACSSMSILSIDPNDLSELRKKYVASCRPGFDDISALKEVLVSVGIPVIDAIGEAEKACSMLCVDNLCSAVFSIDTDNYVYNCPILITELLGDRLVNNSNIELFVKISKISKVYEKLNITYETFVDFCIMCGCDFNMNIKNVGKVKIYKLLVEQKLNSIDNLPKEMDRSVLNYERCRELFKYEKSEDCISNKEYTLIINKNIDENIAKDILAKYNLRDFYHIYDIHYKNIIKIL